MEAVKINSGGLDSKESNNFQLIEGKKTCLTQNKEFQELLMKWSMKGRIFSQCYSFDSHFKPHSAKEFLLDFFSDEAVVSSLLTVSDSGSATTLQERAASVDAAKVSCSLTSMDIFGKLAGEVLRDEGQIQRCFDEWIDEIQISDQLRQMLLNEDSSAYLIYDEAERDELLFRLLRHFSIGGRLCQFEDAIGPYLEIAKSLYKDLVLVQKDANTKQLQVVSHVYSVVARDKDGCAFYPEPEPQHHNSFAYVVIDPLNRQMCVLHHRFGNGLF